MKFGNEWFNLLSAACSAVAVKLLELTTDEPLANLLRATTDIVKLGITPVPACWVLVDVTIASEELDALVSNAHCTTRVVKVDGCGVRV